MTTRSFYGRSTGVLRTFDDRGAACWAARACALAQTSPGVVGEVRVHGNHTTPDADILGIVGDVVGKPATDQLDRRDHEQAREERPVRRRRGPQAVSIDREPRRHPADDRRRRSARHRSARSHAGPDEEVLEQRHVPADPPLRRRLRLHLRRAHQLRRSARPAQPHHGAADVGRRAPGARAARARLSKRARSNASPASSASAAARTRTTRSATPRVSLGARIESAPARWLRLGAGGRRDDVSFGDLDGHGLALRRRRDDRHARRSGVSAQRHPRHGRHRSRDLRRRPRQPEEGSTCAATSGCSARWCSRCAA